MKRVNKKNNKKFKYFVVISFATYIMFTSVLNKTTITHAETNATTTTERKHPVGHKIDGAKYWDYHEEYDKERVITAEGGGRGGDGSSGSGGNSSGGDGTGVGNKGNGGSGNTQGGVGGGLAGNQIGGTGAGQNGTGQGNNEAISALRSLKQAIDESRAESYAKVLETAKDKNKAMESILARESMQESIRKEMAKESIKSKFYEETYEKIHDIPTEASKVYNENSGPPQESETTKTNNVLKWFQDFSELFNQQETTRETNPLDVPTLEPIDPNSNIYSDDQIIPSEVNPQFYEFTEVEDNAQVETRQNAQYIRPLEPQDFIEQTEQKSQTNNVETEVTIEPTASPANRQETENNETYEVTETSEIVPETSKEEVTNDVKEEDKGAEGGKDKDKDADLAGNDKDNNRDSDDNGSGSGQGNTNGNKKGIKIIEIDAIGGIGVGESSRSIDIMKLIMNLIIIICFILGFVFHYIDVPYKNEIKKGYF